jgi:ankyrin repeat protein
MDLSRYTDCELISIRRLIDSTLNERNKLTQKLKHIQAMEGPEVIDNIGTTRLMKAAMNGDIQLVKTLLAYGDPIDKQSHKGYTALYWAINHGQYDIVEFLLKEGSDVHYRTFKNETLLQIADIYKDESMKRILRRFGAKN